MKVLSTVCDRELGGRSFDDVIIEFLAESFQKKTGQLLLLLLLLLY